jgi:hypothetical protein
VSVVNRRELRTAWIEQNVPIPGDFRHHRHDGLAGGAAASASDELLSFLRVLDGEVLQPKLDVLPHDEFVINECDSSNVAILRDDESHASRDICAPGQLRNTASSIYGAFRSACTDPFFVDFSQRSVIAKAKALAAPLAR